MFIFELVFLVDFFVEVMFPLDFSFFLVFRFRYSLQQWHLLFYYLDIFILLWLLFFFEFFLEVGGLFLYFFEIISKHFFSHTSIIIIKQGQ